MSRPRKNILLFCADETQRSVWSFTLRNRGYKVLGGISAYPPLPDVVLIVEDRTLSTAAMAKSISEYYPEVPLLVWLSPGWKTLPEGYPSSSVVISCKADTSAVLERVRCLVIRKRGPKYGWRTLAMVQAALAEHL